MKTLYTPAATNDTVWVLLGSPWFWLLAWLLIINLAAFLVFGIDKWKAKRKERKDTVRRVPEKRLFLLAILGGSVGALFGMKVWHHKTLHKRFRYGLPAILILQILIPLGIFLYRIFAA